MMNTPGLGQRFRAAVKAFRMQHDGQGGNWQFPTNWQYYLPGTERDWGADTGDLWANSAVMVCLSVIQRTFPEARLRVVSEGDDGKEKPIPRHALARLVRQPNPFWSGAHLWKATLLDYSVDGNAYWIKARNGASRAVELWYAPAGTIEPQWPADGSEFISHYIYQPDLAKPTRVRLEVADVVHFRNGIDPNNPRKGYAPIRTAMREIATDNEANTYTAAILKNMGVVGVLLVPAPDVTVTPETSAQLKALWRQQFTGDRRGEPMVPTFPVKPEKVGMTPEEMVLDRIRQLPEARIAALLGVPAMLAGLSVGENQRTYCLPADARVWTACGAKPIAQVQPGDVVWSFVDGGLQLRRVVRAFKTGHKTLYEVRTKNRTLRATGNHPVLVRVPGKLAGFRNEERRPSYQWKPVDALTPGDCLVQVKSLPDQARTTLPDGSPATEDLLQFCGALLGDGNMVCNPRVKRVDMAISATDRAGTRYRLLAAALFTKRVNRGQRAAVHIAERERSFAFCSADAVNLLHTLGFSGVAKTKRIPGWVFALAEPLRLALLAGLVDTDGSVDKRGALSFTFCNKELAHDVRDLLISVGIQCCNIAHGTTESSKIAPYLQNALLHEKYQKWCFTASSSVQVARIPFCDPVYRERVEANAQRERSDGKDARKAGLSSDLGFYEIGSIRELPAEDVYDIEVDEGHSFVADGVVVHNSNQAEAREAFYESTVMPMQAAFAEELSAQLLPDLGNPETERVGWDYSDVRVLQPDMDALAKRAALLYQADVITRAQALELIQMPFTEQDNVRNSEARAANIPDELAALDEDDPAEE